MINIWGNTRRLYGRPHATDLIGEVLGVKASEGTIYELSEIIQPHPALLEAIGEGADVYFGSAIHM